MLLRLIFLALFVLSLHSTDAYAGEGDYAEVTWANLARTLVRLNAIDISDTALLDEYAAITECDMYKAFYQDDFKWNQVRQALRESIKVNIATFPVSYHFDLPLQLDRYDFAAKAFRFAKGERLANVNTFVIFSGQGRACDNTSLKNLPYNFRAVLSALLSLENLPMPEKDAQNFIQRMEKGGNTDRLVYASFNLRVIYIDPLRKQKPAGPGMPVQYGQSNSKDTSNIRLDVRLDSVDFYEDRARTHLLYHYEP